MLSPKNVCRQKRKMENYYKSNGLYDRLLNLKGAHDFQWVSGNAWLLAYGNKIDQEARFLALVSGSSWIPQEEIIESLKHLAQKIKVPVIQIVFDDAPEKVLSSVSVKNLLNEKTKKVSLNDLFEIFKKLKLDVNQGLCGKLINDKASSAYHKWQRATLGNKIIVSDIDLIRTSVAGPVEIIELKRSTQDISKWSPYKEDYLNFSLLKSVSIKAGINFSISYNKMLKNASTKVVTGEITDFVSIFSFDNNHCKDTLRNCSFSDFLDGKYRISVSSAPQWPSKF